MPYRLFRRFLCSHALNAFATSNRTAVKQAIKAILLRKTCLPFAAAPHAGVEPWQLGFSEEETLAQRRPLVCHHLCTRCGVVGRLSDLIGKRRKMRNLGHS